MIRVVVILQEVEQRADARAHERFRTYVPAVYNARSERTPATSSTWFPVCAEMQW